MLPRCSTTLRRSPDAQAHFFYMTGLPIHQDVLLAPALPGRRVPIDKNAGTTAAGRDLDVPGGLQDFGRHVGRIGADLSILQSLVLMVKE